MSDIAIFTKHIPPSVNECFANRKSGGRIRTKRYVAWAAAAGWDMNGHGTIQGPFNCTITIDRTRRHVLSDIDNRIKPTLDILQAHGVIENDKFCESVTARWGDADGGMMIHITKV